MAKHRVDLISNGMEEDGSAKAELWGERQCKGEAMGGGARACEGLRRQSIGQTRDEKAKRRNAEARRWHEGQGQSIHML